jgi:putative exporter of polyketide antibiotics
VFNALDYLSPYAYQDDLWRPRWNEIGTPLLLLGWLGVVYVGAGLLIYRRRDL